MSHKAFKEGHKVNSIIFRGLSNFYKSAEATLNLNTRADINMKINDGDKETILKLTVSSRNLRF